jgi:hypothetical protein
MAYIHASPGSPAIIQLSTATITTSTQGYTLPALQDVTINASNGEFRWQEIGQNSELVVTTPSSNNITANIVIDEDTFFDTTVASTGVPGIFKLSEDKTQVFFRVYFNGLTGRYVGGKGYISSLAPTVSPTAPVWVTPISISVDGELAAT